MAIDQGRAAELMGLSASEALLESGTHRTTLLIRRWEQDQTDWVARRIDPDLVPLVRSGQRTLQLRHFEAAKVGPYSEDLYEGNVITSAGWAKWLAATTASVGSAIFSATVGRLGIGSGSGTFTAADTALSSVTANSGLTGTPNWILFGAAPTVSTSSAPATVVFPAVSYGSGICYGEWSEFAVDQGTANSGSLTTAATAAMVNHGGGTADQYGTKSSTATWNATVTLSFT